MPAGDDRFAELYEKYHQEVRAYCGRRTEADRVDDAVADTFLTAWRRIEDVPSGEETLPWLYGVAYKVLGHQWRGALRRKRLEKKLRSMGLTSSPTPDELVLMREESRRVLVALERLNSTDKEVLLLAAWEGLSHSQTATALGISVGAVRQRFYQARKNLTKSYKRLENKQISSPAAQKGGAW